MRSILLVLFLMFTSLAATAQLDTTFWFAVPEVSATHGDRPVELRISTIDTSSITTVSVPANPSFDPVTDTIPADSSVSIDLSFFLDSLENRPPDQVLRRGLKVEATNKVSVYYVVAGEDEDGAVVNSDLFVFKGTNALGDAFYVPFQNHWQNEPSVDAWSSFDIVATRDNTTITITPTEDLVNHPAGESYTVELDRGETYSARSSSRTGDGHPSGTHIESDKPVAVTQKDDSILENMAYDLVGDQLVPVNLVGRNYIVVKDSNNTGTDRVFITATEDNTQVYVDGSQVTELSAGETYNRQVGNRAFIRTSNPSYVFHVTGFGDELGGALLPSVGPCTGSPQVSFVRDTEEPFELNIITSPGAEDDFVLNGDPNAIDGSEFSSVQGEDSEWMVANIRFSNSEISANEIHLLENTEGDFHLGTLNGVIFETGFRYGYFSAFSQPVDLKDEEFLCRGDSIELEAGGGKDAYYWSTGDSTQSIVVDTPGTYVVTTWQGNCVTRDSTQVAFYPEISEDIIDETDTTVCSNAGYSIDAADGFESYLWPVDSSSGSSFSPDSSGLYTVQVTNSNGCTARDSVQVTVLEAPDPEINYNRDTTEFCTDSTVYLDVGAGYEDYLWMNGATTRDINSSQKIIYWVEVTASNGCKARDTVDIDCSTYIYVPNMFTPNGDGVNDYFQVVNLRPGTWSLRVYNRYGKRVYYNESYDNSWKAKNLPDGTYYFIMEHYKGEETYKSWVKIQR